jgi:hypothetical protein
VACFPKAPHTRITTNLRLTRHVCYFPSGSPVRQGASWPHFSACCLVCLGYLAYRKVQCFWVIMWAQNSPLHPTLNNLISYIPSWLYNMFTIFSSNVSPRASHSFLLLLYRTSKLYCLSCDMLLFYILYFIATAIIRTEENTVAIYFIDSPINSSILVSYILLSTVFSNILSSCCFENNVKLLHPHNLKNDIKR